MAKNQESTRFRLPVNRRRGKRVRKRSDIVADLIKQWIMDGNVMPGGQLPNEQELGEKYEASKGTVREALKSLEVQGLVRIRTGPGGGASVTAVPPERAEELLGNYFYSTNLTLRDVYAMRKVIEPMLVEAVVGHLDEATYEKLDRSTEACACFPQNPDEIREVRMAELDFHEILADACPNPLLGFYARFINRLLKTLAVCDQIYQEPNPELTRHGHTYHVMLLEAFRAGDKARASQLMKEHIEEAEAIMIDYEAHIAKRFFMPEPIPEA